MSDARTVMDAINQHPNLTDTDRTNIAEALGLIGYLGTDTRRTHGSTNTPAWRTGQLDQENQT